jgi:molybdenum cofactor cytidylyltransferase
LDDKPATGPIIGILLAAGRGRRFDASGAHNKLLQTLPDGTLVAVASARNLLARLPRVLAVVGPHAALPESGLAHALREAGCEVSVCGEADAGMGVSLAHALREAEVWQPSGWLIALADMPWVATQTLAALLAAATQQASLATASLVPSSGIFAPYYRGQRGNPVLFLRQHLPALLALQGDQGARALLQRLPPLAVAVDDPGILQDIDTPLDLPGFKNHA